MAQELKPDLEAVTSLKDAERFLRKHTKLSRNEARTFVSMIVRASGSPPPLIQGGIGTQ